MAVGFAVESGYRGCELNPQIGAFIGQKGLC